MKGVIQVMDQEEEIAMQEFARFEEKLRAQKGGRRRAVHSGKGLAGLRFPGNGEADTCGIIITTCTDALS